MSGSRFPVFYTAAVVAMALGMAFGVACKKESDGSGRGKRARQAHSQKSKGGNVKRDQTNKGGGAKRGGPKSSRSRTRGGREVPVTTTLAYPPLESIQLAVPTGWGRYPVKDPTTGLRASYRLPRVSPDSDDVVVRLDHVPGIRGREQAMLIGWFAQELTLSRSVPTADDMALREIPVGEITVTIAEMVGTRRRAGGSRTGDSRGRHMVVIAILDHPDGPHVVRAGGPAQSLRWWYKSILAYIRSARLAS